MFVSAHGFGSGGALLVSASIELLRKVELCDWGLLGQIVPIFGVSGPGLDHDRRFET
jgi:hypothetical protein